MTAREKAVEHTAWHYCEDCLFFANSLNGKNYGRCHAPDAKPSGVDHLISREYPEQPFATVMRIAQCGPEAKWFEQAAVTEKPVPEHIQDIRSRLSVVPANFGE